MPTKIINLSKYLNHTYFYCQSKHDSTTLSAINILLSEISSTMLIQAFIYLNIVTDIIIVSHHTSIFGHCQKRCIFIELTNKSWNYKNRPQYPLYDTNTRPCLQYFVKTLNVALLFFYLACTF